MGCFVRGVKNWHGMFCRGVFCPTFASCIMKPFREVGAIFSLQFSSRTHFAQMKIKKVIAKNLCDKHKKSSLVAYVLDIILFRYVKMYEYM